MILNKIVEIGASIVEQMLIISIICDIGGHRWKEPIKHRVCTIFISILFMGIVTLCNKIQAFSFYTIYIGFVLMIFVSKVFTTGNLLERILACIFGYFMIHTLDYIMSFSAALLFRKSEDVYESFSLIMQQGVLRIGLLVTTKGIEIVLFWLSKAFLNKTKMMSMEMKWFLVILFLGAYIVVSLLLNMILSDSPQILQIAIIISWIFIFICILSVLYASTMILKYENEKMQKEMQKTANDLEQSHYLQLSDQLEEMHSLVHDFKNQILILDELNDNSEIAKAYANEMVEKLEDTYKICKSGNRYIDAVINCKSQQAKREKIQLSYIFKWVDQLPFAAVDICTVLANQLDNAIEACEKIEDVKKRWIHISVIQQHSFVFFTVENSIVSQSIDPTQPLRSTKIKNDDRRHGIGLRNIQITAEKYNGSVKYKIADDTFSITAMLQMEKEI